VGVEVERADALRKIVRAIDSVPGVVRTTSFLTAADSGFLAPRATFLIVDAAPKSGTAEDLVGDLQHRTHRLDAPWRAKDPTVALLWTGEPAFDYDIQATSAEDAAAAERRIAPLTLILLLLVFAALAAKVLPP
jgi:uncharacterized membrane protein YdfJ with MMPL/SSD domain